MLGKHTTYHKESCPLATTDVHENIKNRNWTIENFNYGPLNPDYPNEDFWEKKAELFKTDVCVKRCLLAAVTVGHSIKHGKSCAVLEGALELRKSYT